MEMKTPIHVFAFPLFLLIALPLGSSRLAAQVRSKTVPVEKQNFRETVDAAKESFEAKKYSAAIQKLRAALAIAQAQLRLAILAVMPKAPEGFVAEKPKKPRTGGNPFAALMGMAGQPISYNYKQTKGRGAIRCSITPNSPLVQMMAMAFNMAQHDPDSEVVQYGAHKALLKGTKKKQNYELTILLGGKHVMVVKTRDLTDEQLFKIFDQAFVDKLAAVLSA